MSNGLPNLQAVDLTILVPCKNEEANINDTLDTAVSALNQIDCSYEILVVDDGSTDNTSAVVEKYQAEHPDLPIMLRHNSRNFGLSRTFVDGAFAGRGKYYRLLAGDNCEPPETLLAIVSKMGQADMIIPYHKTRTGSLLRISISRFYTFLVNGGARFLKDTALGNSAVLHNGLA